MKFEFAVKVGVRLDSLSDSEVDDNPVAALADCPINPDVRYGFAAVEKRVKNSLDLQPKRRKIEDLSDIEFVLQPISEDRGTAQRKCLDPHQQIGRELYYRDCTLNKVENL